MELAGAHLSQQTEELAPERRLRIPTLGNRHDLESPERRCPLLEVERELTRRNRKHHRRAYGERRMLRRRRVISFHVGTRAVRHDQVVYRFDTGGVLQSVRDRNGQGVTLSYNSGRLASVSDAAGQGATFTSNADGTLSKIALSDGRSVSFGYTGGRLTSATNPLLKTTTYTYDGAGRLATEVDPNNHTVATNVYDATTGRVTQQTNALGKTTTFAWDSTTQTATITDARGGIWKDVYTNNVLTQRIDATSKATQFGHDSELDTTSVTGPDGSTTSMSYDSRGNLLTATAPASLGSVRKTFTYNQQNNVTGVTDARNTVTSYTYDGNGNLTGITQAGVTVAQYAYNGLGEQTSSTDGNGKTTTYSYDANGNVTSVTVPDPDGPGPLGTPITTYTHDVMGNVLTKVDPLGNCSGCTPANYRTTYSYDADGQLLTETDPLGNTTTHTYDAAGNEASVKDANNHTTAYEYDNADHLTRLTQPDPDGAGPLTAPITTYTYDDGGNRITEVNPRGNAPGGNPGAFTTSYTYDANNRLASETTPKGEKTTYTYDANGYRSSVVEPRGNVQGANPDDYRTTYTYDAAGRLLTTTDPLNNVTTNHYDAVGNLDWTKDANNHQTSYSYDAVGRILSVTAPDGGLTNYTYDSNGNLKIRKDDNNHQTSYDYDDDGRLIQVTRPDPDGTGPLTAPVTTYTYDLSGNRTTMIDPNGNATQTIGDGKTTYTYDRANRPKTIGYSDTTPAVSFGYDGVGNRTSMADGAAGATYIYDALDRLTSATRGTNTFSYAYDASDNITSRTYPDATQTSYTYDEDNRLASAASGGNATSYSYDAASNLIQTALPSGNGYAETRSYDKAGRLIEVKNAKGTSTLSDFNATLDPAGNPTRIDQTGSVSATTTYTYDVNDRLTSVCYQTSCPNSGDPLTTWTYDKVGNRLTEDRPLFTTRQYRYNADDELTGSGSGFTFPGPVSYTYDTDGNEISRTASAGTTTYTYDLAGRLRSSVIGATTTTYSYDGDGNRVQASTGSAASKKTNYLWDVNGNLPQLALERDGNNALLRRYLYGGRRISMTTGGSTYYYHYDGIGSVVNVTSPIGAIEWTDSYAPFGSVRTETQNDNRAPNNFMKFTGEYLDPTGLYHLRARQYDPEIGRFLQVDPSTSTQTSGDAYASDYIYAGDQPTVMVDPSGLTFEPSSDGTTAAASATSPGLTTRSLASASRKHADAEFTFPFAFGQGLAPLGTGKTVADVITNGYNYTVKGRMIQKTGRVPIRMTKFYWSCGAGCGILKTTRKTPGSIFVGNGRVTRDGSYTFRFGLTARVSIVPQPLIGLGVGTDKMHCKRSETLRCYFEY
jgi:RHS repeat-associated protein